MSQPGQLAPLGLLRLREGDIIRLCGFSAAAEGLDLVTRHALSGPRREGGRLHAVFASDVQPSDAPHGSEAASDAAPASVEVWAELSGGAEGTGGFDALRWGCSRHAPGQAPEQPRRAPGCAHVAALLTAWVRAPADFVTPQSQPFTPPQAARASSAPVAGGDATQVNAPSHGSGADRQADARTSSRTSAPDVVQPRLLSAVRASRPAETLADELRRLPAREVTVIAQRALGMELDEADARVRLEAALRDPALLRQILGRLDPEAVEMLTWLRIAGGALTASDVDALAGRSGRPASELRGALGILERHGLVFASTLGAAGPAERVAPVASRAGAGDWRQLKGWRIAPETREALPNDLPLPTHPRPIMSGIAAPGERGRPGRGERVEQGSPRALLLALSVLPYSPAPLGPFATAPVVERIAGGDARPATRPPRPGSPLMPEDLPDALTQDLARGAGLDPLAVRLARRVLLWARARQPSAPVTDLARAPQPARPHALRGGFRLWLEAPSPAELVDLERLTGSVRLRYDHTHDAFRPATLAEEAATVRMFVVRLLGAAPVGAWIAVGDLLGLLWLARPLFLRGRQATLSAPVWRIERIADGRPLRPGVREEWEAAEGAYIRALLTGPLRVWGAVDLAIDDQGAPTFFRLTPLGAFLLSQAEEVERPPERAELDRRAAMSLNFDWGPPVTLTREGTLAAQPLALSAPALDALARWARVTSVAGGRLIFSPGADVACVNFDLGLEPEDALAPLRAAGLDRAAQALAPKLEGWRANYGDSRLTAGVTLAHGRDEATLREALAVLPTEVQERARWLGPTVVALPPDDAAMLRVALGRKGWDV